MTVIPAKPGPYRARNGWLYNMRSRTEISYARYLDICLDRYGEQWRYEPQSLSNIDGDYTPDFYVLRQSGAGFDEVKPWKSESYPFTHRDEYTDYMQLMEIIWDHHPGVFLSLVPWSKQFETVTPLGPRTYFLNRGHGWLTMIPDPTPQGVGWRTKLWDDKR